MERVILGCDHDALIASSSDTLMPASCSHAAVRMASVSFISLLVNGSLALTYARLTNGRWRSAVQTNERRQHEKSGLAFTALRR